MSLPVLALASLAASCGYTFAAPGASALPAAYQVVAVPMVDNRTPEVELGAVCTEALADRFRPARRVVGERGAADLTVEAVVLATRERPLAFAPQGDGTRRTEIEVIVVVALTATGPSGERVDLDALEGSATYLGAGALVATDTRRRHALRRACAEAMTRATVALGSELEGSDGEKEGK